MFDVLYDACVVVLDVYNMFHNVCHSRRLLIRVGSRFLDILETLCFFTVENVYGVPCDELSVMY